MIAGCHHSVEQPQRFEIVSTCKLPGYAKDLDIQGGYAYIANDQGGLQVVDISNPDSTFIAGSYVAQQNFQGVAVRDTFAYVAVAASDGGIMILSVNDPDSIYWLGQDPIVYAYGISAPQGDTLYVYVAARYWFLIEDVSWPQYPSYVRRFATPGNVHSVFMVDSIAYLACEQMGLIVYNLNNPDSTALVGSADTPANARDVFVTGGHAYVADGLGGLVIIDLSDHDSLAIVGQHDTPGYAQGIFIEDSLCYIADREGGMQVFNISDPEDPRPYGELATPYSYNVVLWNGLIYLVDRDLGLVIIQEQ
jgi:hypothetical protein